MMTQIFLYLSRLSFLKTILKNSDHHFYWNTASETTRKMVNKLYMIKVLRFN